MGLKLLVDKMEMPDINSGGAVSRNGGTVPRIKKRLHKSNGAIAPNKRAADKTKWIVVFLRRAVQQFPLPTR
jgi:hypothetical protein